MDEIKEDRSLLEVREWKMQCYEEDKDLTDQEYMEKLRKISDDMQAKYGYRLERVDSPDRITK